MTRAFSLLITAILLSLAGTVAADDFSDRYLEMREKEILKFSRELFAAGEYYRSITEAKRYLSLFPKGPRAEAMACLIGDAYLMSHEWSEAVAAYDRFLEEFPASSLADGATFHKGIALLKLGSNAEAERLFSLLAGRQGPKSDQARRWEIILLIRQNRLEEAESLIKAGMLKEALAGEADLMAELIKKKREAPYKSPAAAGLLSAILPGSGQVYNERYRDGLYSFILNGLFIAGAWKAFDSGNSALGGILTLFEIGWYAGGIYGAVGGAEKFNRRVDEDLFRQGVERLNLRDMDVGTTHGLAVRFTFPF